MKERYLYCELTVVLVGRHRAVSAHIFMFQLTSHLTSHHTPEVPASAAIKFQISLSLPADAQQEVVLGLLLVLRAQGVTVYLLINMILGITL